MTPRKYAIEQGRLRNELDRHQRELGGRGVALLEVVDDLVAVVVLAQVALEEAALLGRPDSRVLGVTKEDVVVEVVLLLELRDVGGAAGALTTLAVRGITGQGEHHDEDQKGGTDEHRDHLEDAPDDVGPHTSPPFGQPAHFAG